MQHALILGLLWPFAPMHLRETLAAGGGTLSDTLHLVLASATVVSLLTAIAFGGALTFLNAPRIGADLPTPWVGVWERINLGVFLLWIVVLAAALLRGRDTVAATSGREALAA